MLSSDTEHTLLVKGLEAPLLPITGQPCTFFFFFNNFTLLRSIDKIVHVFKVYTVMI